MVEKGTVTDGATTDGSSGGSTTEVKTCPFCGEPRSKNPCEHCGMK